MKVRLSDSPKSSPVQGETREPPGRVDSSLSREIIDRDLRIGLRPGCGPDAPKVHPSVRTPILQLFFLTYDAHQSSRKRKLPPTIEAADVIDSGAATLRPSCAPMDTVK